MQIINAPIPTIRMRDLVSPPDTPLVGFNRVYIYNGNLCRLNSDDVQTLVGATGVNAGAKVSLAGFVASPSTVYQLYFNVDEWDIEFYTDTEFNAGYIVIPSGQAGLYLVTLLVEFGPVVGDVEARLELNYATHRLNLQPANTTSGITLQIVEIMNLAEGNALSAVAYQTSAGDVNVVQAVLACQRLTSSQP